MRYVDLQPEIDALLPSIRALVAKHGGDNPLLADVRGWYEAFRRWPEAGALVALEGAVEKVEEQP